MITVLHGGGGFWPNDYIEMTESGTPLLMTEKFNLSVTVVGQVRKDPKLGK